MEDFFSQAWPFAAAILVILGIIALVLLVIILYRTSKTMKSVQNMAAEAEKEVTPALAKVNPIVDKAELLVDTVNLEMLRVDAILEDVEQISDVAGKAATTVDNVTSGPAEAVNSLVDRIRGSISSRRNDKLKESRVVYPIGAGAEADAGASADAGADANASAGTGEVPVSAEQVSAAADEAIKEAAQQVADDISAPADAPMGKHSVHAAGAASDAAKNEEPGE